MMLNIQNVHFKNHWIVEYVRDQYILKYPQNYETFEDNESFNNIVYHVTTPFISHSNFMDFML